jgi:hypothetical protein
MAKAVTPNGKASVIQRAEAIANKAKVKRMLLPRGAVRK